MKALNFKKDSWHFKVATKLGGYTAPFYSEYDDRMVGDNADICTYSKAVARGGLILLIIAVIIYLAALVIMHTLLGVIFSFIYGYPIFTEMGVAGVMLSLIAGITTVLFKLSQYMSKRAEERRYQTKEVKPDGFVKHAYKSWKEKYCMPVNFVE